MPSSDMDVISLEAPAKVNLRLVILGRESSGFHSLETIFCAISLADTVSIERAKNGIELVQNGDIDTGPAQSNLVMRAAHRFYERLGEPPAIRIRLTKKIPAEAGLGGGSSDAATTLRALNQLHDLPLGAGDLLRLGSELGSDVPFFLCGSPLTLAWSRGERLLPLEPLPARHVLVCKPPQSISTAAAFARIAASRGDGYSAPPTVLRPQEFRTWDGIEALAVNDFESVAFEEVPSLRQARDDLRSVGMDPVLLAGSGSAIFGVSDSASVVDRGTEIIGDLGWESWRARTLQGSLDDLEEGTAAG